VIEFGGLPGRETAIAIREAVPPELEFRLFIGIHHNGYTEQMQPTLDECLEWKELDGIDLHGTEDFPLESWTEDYWRRAREAGKYTKAHAGEFCGPEFIRRVIMELGVSRIEHGVRAVEDASVVDLLVERSIGLDVCPISNLKLGVVDSIGAHPIMKLTRRGVCCTLSTDDPISFGNCLEDEYRILYEEAGASVREMTEWARNGFKVALVDEETRVRWMDELDKVAREAPE
jgi:adenosine deaminase